MTEKKFASDTERNRTWANRRKLGGYMVAIGAITDEQIAAFIATVDAVSRIAADPEQIAPPCPCTAQEAPLNMRGLMNTPEERKEIR